MQLPVINQHLPSRRGFLRHLVFGREPVVHNPGAQTLVVVFLRGGADTLNMVVPYGDDRYYAKRPTLAIPKPARDAERDDASIRIDDFFALHPKMKPLVPLFKEGRLGIVNGVGSDNPTGSHFEAQDQIEHGESYGTALGGGWLARHLRVRAGGASATTSALQAIAIGETLPEMLRGAPAASAIRSVDEIQISAKTGNAAAISAALSRMYGAEVGVLGEQGRQTIDLLRKVEVLRGKQYVPANGATYPDDEFGRGLREVARLVKADLGLEAACVDLDGWDTHFFQGTTGGMQADLIDRLSRGLAALDADLNGHRERVTTIVITEFGRRLYENGSVGTDHGRGFALMALGERVNGGRVLGDWPGLDEPNVPVIGPGGMDVHVDYRSVLSEVLTGAAGNDDVAQVFPGFAPKPVGLIHSGSESRLQQI